MDNTNTPGPGPNGVAGQQTRGTSADEAQRQAMQRAEELADHWAEQIGQWASTFGHNILKWAARAREEAEDIWAEAQAIRQGQQPASEEPKPAPPEKTASIWAEAQAIRQRQQSAHSPSENVPPMKGESA